MSSLATVNDGLARRAAAVLPWNDGIYGHMGTRRITTGYPQFYERAEGARVWDVDGNAYVDLMCSWGPVVLGHRHPAVEAAARAQAELGDCLTGPSTRMVELAELMTDTVTHADWAMFMKNGTDATTVCATVARAATGRPAVLAARRAYHGSAPWCTPLLTGTTHEDRVNVVSYEYNDLASVEAAVESCGQGVAAIMVTPFRHDAGFESELVDPDFATGLRRICDRIGAALILDDVRTGFRFDLAGSWEPLGVRPDLSAWGKAMGNGHSIAAVTGTDALRDAVNSIFVTGSYWYSAVPMAAALATIAALRDGDGLAVMERSGQRLRDGLARQAAEQGLEIRQTGPVQMPYLTFVDDVERRLLNRFAVESLHRGVLLHPAHNWFLCAAHGDEEIDAVLRATEEAFAVVALEA